jgi:hypothetical protein
LGVNWTVTSCVAARVEVLGLVGTDVGGVCGRLTPTCGLDGCRWEPAGGGQAGGGSAWSFVNASASWLDQGQLLARRRIVWRAWRASRADWCSSR